MTYDRKTSTIGLIKLGYFGGKIMASGPITSWEIDGETVSHFIFWGSKITADGDCSHEIKRCLLLGLLKSRDITLSIKVHLVKTMVFPVVIYGCESWTIKRAEHWRIGAFELMLEKTFESPLDCKEIQPGHPKGNQSWKFIVRTDVEAETPILWPHDVKCWLIWKDPYAGKDWRQEEKGTTEGEMVYDITNSIDMSLNKLWEWWWTGRPAVLQFMGSQRVRHEWETELNWICHWKAVLSWKGTFSIYNVFFFICHGLDTITFKTFPVLTFLGLVINFLCSTRQISCLNYLLILLKDLWND